MTSCHTLIYEQRWQIFHMKGTTTTDSAERTHYKNKLDLKWVKKTKGQNICYANCTQDHFLTIYRSQKTTSSYQ